MIGDAASVTQRWGTFGAVARPEKLINVVAYNETGVQGDGSALYLQVFSMAPGAVTAPAEGAVPMFSFPVFSKTGGMLGISVDMLAIYCCWSTTSSTKTIAAASGSIVIEVKA